MNVASLWLSVYESGTENGGMRVIPKTHNLELSVSGLRAEDFATDVGFAMHRASYDEAHAVDLCLNPGDISVHHPNTVHGSHANTSNRRRGGLTLRYISTDVLVKVGDLNTYDWNETSCGSLYHVSGEVLEQ